MYSLIIRTVFIPFLWGDSNVSTQEIKGFTSIVQLLGLVRPESLGKAILNSPHNVLKLNNWSFYEY